MKKEVLILLAIFMLTSEARLRDLKISTGASSSMGGSSTSSSTSGTTAGTGGVGQTGASSGSRLGSGESECEGREFDCEILPRLVVGGIFGGLYLIAFCVCCCICMRGKWRWFCKCLFCCCCSRVLKCSWRLRCKCKCEKSKIQKHNLKSLHTTKITHIILQRTFKPK
ncbi:unnamed protein product [Moneuplotes crassus]|uniref:Uncharacterized protein n=1 Tax=Euplotes crassus TaxID=5936 RepID=A0AAD1XV08_EUPCR|nr:unnamed protein product [Moneuplotes crassus]